MAKLESLGTVFSTDILVIGGGIGGLAAAITAKEASPDVDVLVVDKACSGWSGKANKGGGNISYVDPEDNVDEFVKYHVKNIGYFLEDQELLRAYGEESRGNLDRLESWGVHIYRKEDGSPKYVRWTEGLPWRMAVMDQDVTLNMLQHARKQGTKFIDRVAIVDLLKEGDRVTGAIGFSIIDGACHIIKAKATIIANGGQNYRLMRRWSSGRGDGIAAAYRAGAEMRNAEFGNFINWIFVDSRDVCQGAEDVLYNAKGEHITKAIRPVIECDLHSKEVVAWWKEMKAGNGPVCANMAENRILNEIVPAFHSDALAVRPIATAFWGRTIGKAMSAATKKGPMQEVVPGFIGEQAPIKVDHRMATTLPGLFAIGDASFTGSAWAGAVPMPGRMRGTGLGFATFSGVRCGPAAATYVSGAAEARIDPAQAEVLKERMFAPLARTSGVEAPELVRSIQDVMSPAGNSIYMRQDRLEAALNRVLELKAKAAELRAKDWQYLSAGNEVRSMLTSAEMFYRAALTRKESRGWHMREDYPQTDNTNWLKRIIIQDRKGEMLLTTEAVPVEKYPCKP
ncbi:MAG: SdhA [Deltaproteobacteria bacterium]|nr:SdhA [Deltaproteobacteria bacterium]